MLKINIVNQYDGVFRDTHPIKKTLHVAYRYLKIVDPMTINIILVENLEIQRLNRTYRQKDEVTDVLSFENTEGLSEIGDVFIAVDQAKTQAESYGHSLKREIAFLALHGFLHCLGYDHLTSIDEDEMFQLQDQILANTPYKR